MGMWFMRRGRFEPGEIVALVGGSGCGKSTVVGLVQRLWEPTEGDAWVGGERLGEVDVKWLRDRLAVVSQQPTLFDTSVGENIRCGSLAKADETATTASVITDVDIRTAAKWANVHQVIVALGDDTVFGTNAGGGLSGGRAQRVQIARALARIVHPSNNTHHPGADMLILDEGTSALD